MFWKTRLGSRTRFRVESPQATPLRLAPHTTFLSGVICSHGSNVLRRLYIIWIVEESVKIVGS